MHHPIDFSVEDLRWHNGSNIYCEDHTALWWTPFCGVLRWRFGEAGESAAEEVCDGGIADTLEESRGDDRKQGIEIGTALVICHNTGCGIKYNWRFLARGNSETDGWVAVVADLWFGILVSGIAVVPGSLDRETDASGFVTHTGIVPGRPVVSNVSDESHPDADLFRFGDSVFSCAHHWKIAECAVSVKHDSCWRFMDDADIRVRIEVSVFKPCTISVNSLGAVATDAA